MTNQQIDGIVDKNFNTPEGRKVFKKQFFLAGWELLWNMQILHFMV